MLLLLLLSFFLCFGVDMPWVGNQFAIILVNFRREQIRRMCSIWGRLYFPKVITIISPVLLCSFDVTMAFLLSGGWSYFSLLSNPDELLTMVEVLLYDF